MAYVYSLINKENQTNKENESTLTSMPIIPKLRRRIDELKLPLWDIRKNIKKRHENDEHLEATSIENATHLSEYTKRRGSVHTRIQPDTVTQSRSDNGPLDSILHRCAYKGVKGEEFQSRRGRLHTFSFFPSVAMDWVLNGTHVQVYFALSWVSMYVVVRRNAATNGFKSQCSKPQKVAELSE
ncbi:predicted protein [Histoplasma capsulatum H143]|uniref:Uncharacterized protein n=1 Tax=Ajellomyces capsulatus (strain H143) TaxID=544712 RepID=C6H8E0_AJECH|nr:predicted protein [Histoplasma capsulatum H143]